MGFALLWLESLAGALLIMAASTAAANRYRKWLGLPLVAAAVLLPLAVGGCALFVAYALHEHGADGRWITYTTAWMIGDLAGIVWIAWKGRRRAPETGDPAARGWHGRRLAGAALAAGVLLGMTFEALSAAVDRRLAVLGEEARATALALAPPAVPDERNAALVYEEAFEIIGLSKDRGKILSEVDRPAFDTSSAAAGRLLNELRPALALLRRAADMPAYVFLSDPSRGLGSRTPSLLPHRESAQLLALDARARAARGDAAGAVADLVAIRRTARHLANNPQIISCMVAISLEGIGDNVMEDILSVGQAKPSDLAPYLEDGDVSYRWPVLRSLQMEEAGMLLAFSAMASFPPREAQTDSIFSMYNDLGFKVFLAADDVSAYRQVMSDLQQALRKPYVEAVAELERNRASAGDLPGGILTSIAVPSTSGFLRMAATGDARNRLARLAAAAAALHARTGKYPETLDALLPEGEGLNAIDPFDGRPLRLKAADGGLLLYSVGENGKDDGGAQKQRGASAGEGDLTFCLGGAYAARRLAPEK